MTMLMATPMTFNGGAGLLSGWTLSTASSSSSIASPSSAAARPVLSSVPSKKNNV